MDADYRRRTGRIFDIQKYSIHAVSYTHLTLPTNSLV